MNHLKTIFFFVICLAVGVGIGRAYLEWRGPEKRGFEHQEGPPVITGVGDAPAHRGFALAAEDWGSLPAALNGGREAYATTVGLHYGRAGTREGLVQAVGAIHQRKMAALVLPEPVFQAHNPYPRPLAEIASEVQAAGAEFLCISWLGEAPDAAYWRGQIQAVRAVFKGKIILAGRPEILARVGCWDAVDMIGAAGPMTLPQRLPDAPEEVSLHDERVAWDCVLTSLETLAEVNTKKLALLHMNVPVEIAARLVSPEAANVKPARNPSLQRTVYEALLLETKGRAKTTDVLIFSWGNIGTWDAPPIIPGLLEQIGNAWDPKKPRPEEPVPAPLPPETEEWVEGMEEWRGEGAETEP